MSPTQRYGDQYENTVIFIMSLAIVLSIVGVVILNKVYYEKCVSSYVTYCGDTSTTGHKDH